MECYYHPGVAASGTCTDCGKALCTACMSAMNPPTCRECGVAYCNNKLFDAYFNLVVMAIAFFTGYYWETGSQPLGLTPSPLATGILFAVGLVGLKVFFKFFFNTFNVAMCIILGLPGLIVMAVFLAFTIALSYFIMPVAVLYFVWTIYRQRGLRRHVLMRYA